MHCFLHALSATDTVRQKSLRLVETQQACSINMYMCLSRVPVTALVVRQQVEIFDANNLLVPMNERVLSVVWHQDNIIQLCVVVILNHIFQALVEVIVLLKALIS